MATIISEPNDLVSDATDTGLTSASPSPFVGTGVIGDNPALLPGMDVDLLRLDLDLDAILTIDIDAEIDGAELDSVLRVFDAGGVEIASNDDGVAPGEAASFDSYLGPLTLAAGTYLIGISAFDNIAYDPATIEGRLEGLLIGAYTVTITAAFAIPGGVERIGGDGSDSLAGTAFADTLIGNGGNDTLDGGADSDLMNGGPGDDVFVVDSAGDVVEEGANAGTDRIESQISLTSLPANVENLSLTGTADLTGAGNGLKNVLTGNGGNDSLRGLAGNDTLSGQGGNDTLDGGSGNDSLSGGDGEDSFAASSGADTMAGGAGNDHYFFNSTNDRVIEAAGEGEDLIEATVGLTLMANVENVVLAGSRGLSVTGNNLANTMTGYVFDDTLFGRGGNDTLAGGDGNDRLDGGNGRDSVAGGAGDDTVLGGGGADTLAGGDGNDVFDGGAGTDTLVWTATALDSGDVGAGTQETLLSGAGDRLDFTAALEALLRVGGTALSAATQNVSLGAGFDPGTNVRFTGSALQIDLDGDQAFTLGADFAIDMAGAGVSGVVFDAAADLFVLL